MADSMNMLNLERRLETILESPKTTVSLDANIFKPPVYSIEMLQGVDFSELFGHILNGYNIMSLITKQKLYNENMAKAARNIEVTNRKYIDFLAELFEKYENLIMPIQVKKELEKWIESSDLEGYEKWVAGGKNTFAHAGINRLVSMRENEPYFAPIFCVQHEYKRMLRDFLKKIPKKRVIDYNNNDELPEIIGQLGEISKEGGNVEDKEIFVTSLLATEDMGNENLAIFSFDKSMKIIANRIYEKNIKPEIGIKVYGGYSLKLRKSTGNPIPIRFEQSYPKITEAQLVSK